MQLVQDPDSGEFVWDAKGSRIIRVGDAKGDADAVNFRTVLVLIEQIQNGGGSVGIAPKFWSFEGDGEVTDFRWPAPTSWTPCSTTPHWRKRPGLETTWYRSPATQILPGCEGVAPAIRFTTALADGQRGFTTLRGYARPWIGETPIYTVAPAL